MSQRIKNVLGGALALLLGGGMIAWVAIKFMVAAEEQGTYRSPPAVQSEYKP